jgi:hypothetical protein
METRSSAKRRRANSRDNSNEDTTKRKSSFRPQSQAKLATSKPKVVLSSASEPLKLIGAHVSAAKGIENAPQNAKDIGYVPFRLNWTPFLAKHLNFTMQSFTR